jgi:hypothetical protein
VQGGFAMKKPLYFALALLLALALSACGGDTDNGNTPGGNPDDPNYEKPFTLDQRLVGGRWYFPETLSYSNPGDGTFTVTIKPKYSEGYYEFTDDSLIFSDNTKLRNNTSNYFSVGNPFYSKVYSKNGIVYWKHDNKKVMQYELHDKFPYADNHALVGLTSTWRACLDYLAADGNMITYRLFQANGDLCEDESNLNFD